MANCSICRDPRANVGVSGDGKKLDVTCPNCGTFTLIAGEIDLKAGEFTSALQIVARSRRIRGLNPPLVVDYTYRNIEVPGYDTMSPSDVLAAVPRSVGSRLNEAMINLSLLFKPGIPLALTQEDYPALYADNARHGQWVLRQLRGRGFIADGNQNQNIELTAAGWERAEELTTSGANKHPPQAFVAMSFKDTMECFVEGFHPAIQDDCGYRDIRMDLLDHADLIDDRMLAEIRASRFLVADLTHANNGAYFEAGFALALGMKVIYTVHEDHWHDVHFDVNHYPVIRYSDHTDLRVKLRNRIRALFGDAVTAVL